MSRYELLRAESGLRCAEALCTSHPLFVVWTGAIGKRWTPDFRFHGFSPDILVTKSIVSSPGIHDVELDDETRSGSPDVESDGLTLEKVIQVSYQKGFQISQVYQFAGYHCGRS